MYAQVLVSYDITETKPRNQLFNALKDLGLIPIQKSVFWGYILSYERRTITELFHKYCDENTDKAFIVNAVMDKTIEHSIGYHKEDFKHPEGFEII